MLFRCIVPLAGQTHADDADDPVAPNWVAHNLAQRVLAIHTYKYKARTTAEIRAEPELHTVHRCSRKVYVCVCVFSLSVCIHADLRMQCRMIQMLRKGGKAAI